jgi:hypothetical protein
MRRAINEEPDPQQRDIMIYVLRTFTGMLTYEQKKEYDEKSSEKSRNYVDTNPANPDNVSRGSSAVNYEATQKIKKRGSNEAGLVQMDMTFPRSPNKLKFE